VQAETHQLNGLKLTLNAFNFDALSAADLLRRFSFTVDGGDNTGFPQAVNHNAAAGGNSISVAIVGHCHILAPLTFRNLSTAISVKIDG
jgi:hypothetical protein